MNVAVIGTGYVGLVTGACFSEFGVDVVCVDQDSEKVSALQRGEMPIYEPGLDDLVARNASSGRLLSEHYGVTLSVNLRLPTYYALFPLFSNRIRGTKRFTYTRCDEEGHF